MFHHLQVAIGFIFATSVLILFGLVSVILYKWRNMRIARKRAQFLEKHQDYFAYVMAYLDSNEPLKIPAKSLSKWDLIFLQEQLIELAERVKGGHRERLSILFEQLGLPSREMTRLAKPLSATRIDAAYKLGAMGSGQAVPALFSLLEKERDDSGRFIVARAIVRCARDVGDLREMVTKMVSFSPDSPRLIAELLLESRLDLSPLLKEWLNHSDLRLVHVAVAGLSHHLDEELAHFLRKLQRSEEKELRIKATKLFLQTNLWVTPAQVESLMADDDWEIRAITAKAIGRWREEAYLSLLVQVMEDSNWWVRRNAARSLLSFGEAGFRALCEIAVHSRKEESVDLAMQTIQEALRYGEAGYSLEEKRLKKQRLAIYQAYFAARKHQAI
jgi:HEAT repeat protein